MNQHGSVTWQKWLIVVPARMGSERLKNKPLQLLGDKPLIVQTFANISSLLSAGATVVVATDHQDIMDICRQNSIPAMMTDAKHKSGTDRVFEVSKKFNHPYIMNVQGDEPFLNKEDISKLMAALEGDNQADIATLAYKSKSHEDFQNPSVVKAVKAPNGRALYFSRSPVPHPRKTDQAEWSFWHHQGIYAYRRESLKQFCGMLPGSLEYIEQLEQLRALENGMHIQLIEAMHCSKGIDTPEDLEAARALL